MIARPQALLRAPRDSLLLRPSGTGDDCSAVDVQLRKNRMEPEDSYTLLCVDGYVCMLHTLLPISPAGMWLSWSVLEQLTYAEE